MRRFLLALPLVLTACSTPSAREPSLTPRAAEAIDPRVPIPSDPVLGPADPALAARLEQLVAEVQAGGGAFDSLVDDAQRLAAAAGPAESESWISAQQALSALVAARAPVTRAMAEIDELASARIRSGGIAAGDLAAIRAAAAAAGAVNQRQAEIVNRLEAALSR